MKFYTPVLRVLGIKAMYDQDEYTAMEPTASILVTPI